MRYISRSMKTNDSDEVRLQFDHWKKVMLLCYLKETRAYQSLMCTKTVWIQYAENCKIHSDASLSCRHIRGHRPCHITFHSVHLLSMIYATDLCRMKMQIKRLHFRVTSRANGLKRWVKQQFPMRFTMSSPMIKSLTLHCAVRQYSRQLPSME